MSKLIKFNPKRICTEAVLHRLKVAFPKLFLGTQKLDYDFTAREADDILVMSGATSISVNASSTRIVNTYDPIVMFCQGAVTGIYCTCSLEERNTILKELTGINIELDDGIILGYQSDERLPNVVKLIEDDYKENYQTFEEDQLLTARAFGGYDFITKTNKGYDVMFNGLIKILETRKDIFIGSYNILNNASIESIYDIDFRLNFQEDVVFQYEHPNYAGVYSEKLQGRHLPHTYEDLGIQYSKIDIKLSDYTNAHKEPHILANLLEVVAHELCHTVYPEHDASFHELMESFGFKVNYDVAWDDNLGYFYHQTLPSEELIEKCKIITDIFKENRVTELVDTTEDRRTELVKDYNTFTEQEHRSALANYEILKYQNLQNVNEHFYEYIQHIGSPILVHFIFNRLFPKVPIPVGNYILEDVTRGVLLRLGVEEEDLVDVDYVNGQYFNFSQTLIINNTPSRYIDCKTRSPIVVFIEDVICDMYENAKETNEDLTLKEFVRQFRGVNVATPTKKELKEFYEKHPQPTKENIEYEDYEFLPKIEYNVRLEFSDTIKMKVNEFTDIHFDMFIRDPFALERLVTPLSNELMYTQQDALIEEDHLTPILIEKSDEILDVLKEVSPSIYNPITKLDIQVLDIDKESNFDIASGVLTLYTPTLNEVGGSIYNLILFIVASIASEVGTDEELNDEDLDILTLRIERILGL